MNDLERRSFYSFLGLYVISSALLISLVAYLYYNAQKQSMETQLHYRLEHVADKESSKIIAAHMNGYMFTYVPPQEPVEVAMFDKNNSVVFGVNRQNLAQYRPGYYHAGEEIILVSEATRGHLGIDRIVVASKSLSEDIAIYAGGGDLYYCG